MSAHLTRNFRSFCQSLKQRARIFPLSLKQMGEILPVGNVTCSPRQKGRLRRCERDARISTHVRQLLRKTGQRPIFAVDRLDGQANRSNCTNIERRIHFRA
jgi:hypothetical protein